MHYAERIEVNPRVRGGRPVIRGTRITVEYIVRNLNAGISLAELFVQHPQLTHEDIQAATAYAAGYVDLAYA
jgi:uncharacterized protein (DUF433 family)